MSFNKIAALYVFCMNYHEGQSSRLYRIMSRIVRQYKIRLTDNAIASIESEYCGNDWYYANLIYWQLVNRWIV